MQGNLKIKSGISIIICCYNSEKKILDVLKHLEKLDEGNINIEIIVVDNSSTDLTFKISQSFFDSSSIYGFVVKEPTQGLSFARKTGVTNASFNIVLFCDDDNFFEDDYLQLGYDHFQGNSMLGCLGGLGIPKLSLDLPYWFPFFSSSYAIGSLGKNDGVQPSGSIHYGAGLFFRKEPLLSFFDRKLSSTITDRKGNSLSSGGDSELCLGVQLEGYQIAFDSRLRFFHNLEDERISESYYIKLKKGILANFPILTAYEFLLKKEPKSYSKYLIGKFPMLTLGLIKTLITFLIKRDFVSKVYFYNYYLKLHGLIINYSKSMKLYKQLKVSYSL